MDESSSNSRRSFLRSLGLLTATAAISPQSAFSKEKGIQKLTVLHTNDVHSRIDPFPEDGSRNAGLAGVARRAALINKIRSEEEHVLLLDAGDIFQGTPYFNMYGGELELKLMSQMGYDAATLGNHDFDNGIDGLLKQLPHASFPFLVSNYDFSETAMAGKVQPYKVFKKGSLRIGVLGVGIDLNGLVDPIHHKGVKYLDPIELANDTAKFLKEKQNCDLVICLSHLGYKYANEKVSDRKLAIACSNIDLIIGGHTHTFMKEPEKLKAADGKDIQIFQVGFAGINLGRIDFYFEQKGRKITSVAHSLRVDVQADEIG